VDSDDDRREQGLLFTAANSGDADIRTQPNPYSKSGDAPPCPASYATDSDEKEGNQSEEEHYDEPRRTDSGEEVFQVDHDGEWAWYRANEKYIEYMERRGSTRALLKRVLPPCALRRWRALPSEVALDVETYGSFYQSPTCPITPMLLEIGAACSRLITCIKDENAHIKASHLDPGLTRPTVPVLAEVMRAIFAVTRSLSLAAGWGFRGSSDCPAFESEKLYFLRGNDHEARDGDGSFWHPFTWRSSNTAWTSEPFFHAQQKEARAPDSEMGPLMSVRLLALFYATDLESFVGRAIGKDGLLMVDEDVLVPLFTGMVKLADLIHHDVRFREDIDVLDSRARMGSREPHACGDFRDDRATHNCRKYSDYLWDPDKDQDQQQEVALFSQHMKAREEFFDRLVESLKMEETEKLKRFLADREEEALQKRQKLLTPDYGIGLLPRQLIDCGSPQAPLWNASQSEYDAWASTCNLESMFPEVWSLVALERSCVNLERAIAREVNYYTESGADPRSIDISPDTVVHLGSFMRHLFNAVTRLNLGWQSESQLLVPDEMWTPADDPPTNTTPQYLQFHPYGFRASSVSAKWVSSYGYGFVTWPGSNSPIRTSYRELTMLKCRNALARMHEVRCCGGSQADRDREPTVWTWRNDSRINVGKYVDCALRSFWEVGDLIHREIRFRDNIDVHFAGGLIPLHQPS